MYDSKRCERNINLAFMSSKNSSSLSHLSSSITHLIWRSGTNRVASLKLYVLPLSSLHQRHIQSESPLPRLSRRLSGCLTTFRYRRLSTRPPTVSCTCCESRVPTRYPAARSSVWLRTTSERPPVPPICRQVRASGRVGAGM